MTDVAIPMPPPTAEPTVVEPVDQTVQRSPRTHVDSAPLPTDSMVTVPLSETDGRTPEDDQSACSSPTSPVQPDIVVGERRTSSARADSIEIRQAFGRSQSQSQTSADATTTPTSPTISVRDTDAPESPKIDTRERRTSNGSGKSEEVDWAELEKKEEQEPEGEEEVRAHSRYLMPVVC